MLALNANTQYGYKHTKTAKNGSLKCKYVIQLPTHKYSNKWKPQMQIHNIITNTQIQQKMEASNANANA